MAPGDEEKISFITDLCTYYYKVMSFGLKNAETIYQWLVNKIFKEQMGQNLKAYVDDMLVKYVQKEGHEADLRETFNVLR